MRIINAILWGITIGLVSIGAASAETFSDAEATPDYHSIQPGLIAGMEGGVASVDWPSFELATDAKRTAQQGSVLSKTSHSQIFTGTAGFFIGYKIPTYTHFALEPMLAYHYVASSSHESIFVYATPPSLRDYASSTLTMIDLTLQGNYRLDTGVNFFIQPGFAVINNAYRIAYDLDYERNTTGNTLQLRPEIALGAGFMLTEHLNVFGKYTYIFGNDLNAIFPTMTPNVSLVNIGLSVEA